MEELMILVDEEGVEHQFEVEAILDVEDEKYAVLLPQDSEYVDSEEAIIMKFGVDDEGEEVLFDVESDEEWNMIANVYDEILEEELKEMKDN
ncbi:MAG: DUF1292 domain-containing protein [Bacillota bacterium]